MCQKRGLLFAICLGVVAVALFEFLTIYNDHTIPTIRDKISLAKQTCEPCYNVARNLQFAAVRNELLSWHFYVLVGIILLLESIRPVYKRSRLFPASFFHDFLWFLVDILFVGMLLPIYQTLLFRIYESSLGSLQVDAIKTWPLAGQILIAVFV